MTLPASFIRDGFLPQNKIRKTRRLLIGTDGPANSGKTEFILSAPDPGIVICLDRGFDAMLDNPNPPATRGQDFAFSVIPIPLNTQGKQDLYQKYWREFYAVYLSALKNPDALTIGLDGDSDSWELQRLAEFGQLSQIPPLRYMSVNAARRAMISRAWDSGKIIIATNKISKQYKPTFKPDGSPMLTDDGREVREWDGKSYERQGFKDHEYLWQIQLRHLYRPAGVNALTKKPYAQSWGIKIVMCKVNRELEGVEIWGDDCNFAGLVQTVYPDVSLEEWGYR